MPDLGSIAGAISLLIMAYVAIRNIRNQNAEGNVNIGKAYSDLIAELKTSNAELKKENVEIKGRLLEQEDLIEGLKVSFEKLEKLNKEYLAKLQLREAQLIAAKIDLWPFEAKP